MLSEAFTVPAQRQPRRNGEHLYFGTDLCGVLGEEQPFCLLVRRRDMRGGKLASSDERRTNRDVNDCGHKEARNVRNPVGRC